MENSQNELNDPYPWVLWDTGYPASMFEGLSEDDQERFKCGIW